MKSKVLSILIVVFLLLGGLIGVFDLDRTAGFASAKTLYVGGTGGNNYTYIQDAIDNASIGDTVFVYNGLYNESLVINKTIDLVGEDMYKTVINGNFTGNRTGDVIYVTANNVMIKGFSIRHGGSNYLDAGIEVNSAKNCTIMNNNISFNAQIGVQLTSARNITIKNNIISNNGYSGIYLSVSWHNLIRDNTLIKNQLYLTASSHNILENNTINGNSASTQYPNGVYLHYYSNFNKIVDNLIKNCQGNGIVLYYSFDNNITGNNVTNCAQSSTTYAGVSLQSSERNMVYNNQIISNVNSGIFSQNSNRNQIVLNNIYNNKIGIYWGKTDQWNKIYLNELKNNMHNTAGASVVRNWNSSVPMGYIYNNTNFTSYLGNYWHDYTGSDLDGNGIGDTPYLISKTNTSTERDNYPLMKPVSNYILIPTSIKVDMDSVSKNSTNINVSLLIHEATLHAVISGVLNGSIKITGLKMVIINSSSFSGKGFFIANWTGTVEGKNYHGQWHGMLFNKTGERRIYLKGTLAGGLKGITDGYLLESSPGSGKYNVYNSTWTINYVGSDPIFAQLTVNGTLSYQSSKDTSSEIYILQTLYKGNATGYYNGSLDVVLTHVRINNKTSRFHGHGFSFITYTSKYGTGQGWTFDLSISQHVVKLTGFFTEPLWGLAFGTLDETGVTAKLKLSIVRIDLGLPPRAILAIVAWGPSWVSPGQTVHFILEVTNYGLKGVNDTEIILELPKNATYVSSTCCGIYNSSTHEVSWKINISAKSKKQVSAKCTVKWGLPQGSKLKIYGYIQDYKQNITLAYASFTSIVRTAKDPNAKYGPDGNVTAGQLLNYRLEFENEGSGIAFGVYFTDQLSEHLNDSSLTIGPVRSTKDNSNIAPAGHYNPDTRTITWLVGEVGPKEGGYSIISIKVNDDAAVGTEILNYGTVYFPSVPEVTRTNGIVSIVKFNQRPSANAGSSLVVKTLENIVFDGSGSSDPDGEIINYTWEFGDGGFGYGITTSHSYSDDGNYKVKLTVEDDLSGTDTHEITVQVQNRAPTAVLEADITELFTDYQVTFNAVQSNDLDGNVVEYKYDFGDGTDSDWIWDTSIKHYYSDGTIVYTASLLVRDDDGDISTNIAELEITVKNHAPEASVSANKLEGFTYEDITFNAELSSDPDGDIVSYYFDFGDGQYSTWSTESTVTHQYTDGPKEYTVQLLVKDDDGETGVAEVKINIKNRAPIADAGIDLVVDTNQDIKFDGKLSSDLDGVIQSYAWDFGDSNTGTGKVVTHAYMQNGQYTVTLTVTDDDGAVGKDTCKIIVNNIRPVAGFTVTPETGDINTVFKFSSTSNDPDGAITNFYWDFGDGSTAAEVNPSHQFKARGMYTVSLKVEDDDGAESEVFEKEISIKNLPPVAVAISSLETAEVGESVTFDASGSYDPDGAITSFSWQFGDSHAGKGKVIQHTYSSKGIYTITLTITDDADELTMTTIQLEVKEQVPDYDGDGIPDHLDPDDDNDGLPDLWEEKYGFNPKNAADATLDPDNDNLNNLEEYFNETDPKNPDTDGDGLDDYNDPFPNDPLRPGKGDDTEVITNDFNYQALAIFAVIIILIIIIILAFVLRKNKGRGRQHEAAGEPYDQDATLYALRDEVLTDGQDLNLSISRDSIKGQLDTSRKDGEISEETYKYINEQILHEDAEVDQELQE